LTSIGSAEPYDLIANLKWLAPASSPETPNTKGNIYSRMHYLETYYVDEQ